MFEELQKAVQEVTENMIGGVQEGGASKVAKKREKLNNMTCEQLRQKAKKLKLTVTKKKDGKNVNIKKASLVSKILKHMVQHKMM